MRREDLIQEIVENIARCQRPANFSKWHEIGLSHAQLGMLFMLSHHKQLQIKQIAQYLGISKSAASQVITLLTDKGLVERRVEPADRRVVHLMLTAKGAGVVKKLHKFKFAGLRSRLENLSAQELEKLAVLCKKMASVI
jgi:DNA-binding MarR family transcriptional regulator